MIAIVIFLSITFKVEYEIQRTLLTFLIMLIVFKIIFHKSVLKTAIAVTFFIIEMLFADIVNTTLLMIFFSAEEIRGVWYIMILSNLNVAFIIMLINKIKILTDQIKRLMDKTEEKALLSLLIFWILTVVIIVILFYNTAQMFGWNSDYLINLFIMITFFSLSLIFIIEKSNYDNLQKKYDMLFEYVKNFEDFIEEEQYNRHEYKNELAILRTKIKDKKIRKEIDEIINIASNLDQISLEQLARVPKGGLKGLLYYKTIIAHNNKVNLVLDITKGIKGEIEKLRAKEIKELSNLLGIYLDNAIEAAKATKEKNVTIEIYHIDNNLNIVISNSYCNKIDLEGMDKKGVSSKGRGRGNGLHFAKKLLNNNKWISHQRLIVSNFYIQKLIVDTSGRKKKKYKIKRS